jgi:altronate dehydratase
LDDRYDAIRLHEDDNVATLVRAAEAGATIKVAGPSGLAELIASEPIPLCHKVALTAIEPGDTVRKYGQPIGSAVASIAAGRHVHVHNMHSDKAGGGRRAR